MIREERLAEILQYINQKKFVSIHELCKVFSISKATVRRDLNQLNKTGHILLSRGGARYMQEAENELPYDEKRKHHKDEKLCICQRACEIIKDGSLVIIDTGTTTREMAQFLKDRKNLHIVTNDIMIAVELATNRFIDLTVTGGSVRKGYYTLNGYSAESFLQQLHADIAFLSLDAVDSEMGGMITNMDEITLKQRIIQCADYVVALCDHSKFGKKSFLKVCSLEEIDLFITGKELPKAILNSFEQRDAKIQLV